MADIYEVIKTINQIAHNAYDGACDENGEPIKIGLMREEGDPILDSRVMDGFKVGFGGNMMKLCYTTETRLRDVYAQNDFEGEMTSRVEDIVSFLKKEYRKVQKETLQLEMKGEPQVFVQHMSNYRTWAEVKCVYEIGNIEKIPERGDAEKKLDTAIEKWISQQGKA